MRTVWQRETEVERMRQKPAIGPKQIITNKLKKKKKTFERKCLKILPIDFLLNMQTWKVWTLAVHTLFLVTYWAYV